MTTTTAMTGGGPSPSHPGAWTAPRVPPYGSRHRTLLATGQLPRRRRRGGARRPGIPPIDGAATTEIGGHWPRRASWLETVSMVTWPSSVRTTTTTTTTTTSSNTPAWSVYAPARFDSQSRGYQQQEQQQQEDAIEWLYRLYSDEALGPWSRSLRDGTEPLLPNHHPIVASLRRQRRRPPLPRQHPFMSLAPSSDDRSSRWWSQYVLTPTRCHWIRDAGLFRGVLDAVVTGLAAPTLALALPQMALQYRAWPPPRPTPTPQCFRTLHYGAHPRQFLHWYPGTKWLSPARAQERDDHHPAHCQAHRRRRRLVVFVHGGAWGTGRPWMYRLLAAPHRWFVPPSRDDHEHSGDDDDDQEEDPADDAFDDVDVAPDVAIVSFRTYPDGVMAQQVADCHAALQQLHDWYQQTCPHCPVGVTLAGHSSGAQTALLVLVERALAQCQSRDEPPFWNAQSSSPFERDESGSFWEIDTFVGLSGPYHLGHHFDYEASRGVEELSPMKPVGGYTRDMLCYHSPAPRLAMGLAQIRMQQPQHSCLVSSAFPRHMLLLHGMSDTTVPFTATSDCARQLRAAGLTTVDEMYLAGVDHQETIVQMMIGHGPTSDAVRQWLTSQLDSEHSPVKTDNNMTKVVVHSRL